MSLKKKDKNHDSGEESEDNDMYALHRKIFDKDRVVEAICQDKLCTHISKLPHRHTTADCQGHGVCVVDGLNNAVANEA